MTSHIHTAVFCREHYSSKYIIQACHMMHTSSRKKLMVLLDSKVNDVLPNPFAISEIIVALHTLACRAFLL